MRSEASPIKTELKCRVCGGCMAVGTAFKNTANYGIPDFAGQTDRVGQTFSYTGPPVQVSVWKCESCGHSFETLKQ